MSKIHFYKMHAAGNDFILIDNTAGIFQGNETSLFNKMCLPHTGIGANGILLLEKSDKADFKIRYFNSDGLPAELCGNGVRCATYLANYLKLAPPNCSFEMNEEIYSAEISERNFVRLQLNPPEILFSSSESNSLLAENFEQAMWLNTGVPHLVIESKSPLEELDIVHWGRHYRNHPKFKPSGTNVNFVIATKPNQLKARVYERGVEEETLACGSGAVACAVFANKKYGWQSPISVQFPGGNLQVEFEPDYEKIFLSGPVERVFEGDFTRSNFE